MTKFDEIMARLRELANPRAVAGMAKYGINPENTLGVSIPNLRRIAKETGKDHGLALELWKSGVHEARILASMVDDPKQVTEAQAEEWVAGFDSWDVCDQVCMNLLEKLPFAYEKAAEWAGREEEFVRRAGFALVACLAWHDKSAPDEKFIAFLPVIRKHSTDDRNFVKKAVNWALRNMGKRNRNLCARAIETAGEIEKIDSRAARWIARDALRELTSEKIQERLSGGK